MEMNKKGIFFTLLSVTFVSLLFLYLSGAPKIPFKQDTDLATAEFLIVNGFVKDAKESSIKDILYIQSYRAVKALSENVTQSSAIDDVQLRFRESLNNATLYSAEASAMQGTTISDWSDLFGQKSMKLLRIKSNFTVVGTQVSQVSPWYVTATINYTFFAQRNNITYSFNDTMTIDVPLDGIKDPVFSLNGFERQIRKTSIRYFNVTNIGKMIEDGSYRHTILAPSFLSRLENKTMPSPCCGIESFTNLTHVLASSNTDVSYVDHLFWTYNRSCMRGDYSLYNFTYIDNDVLNGFKLDMEYAGLYGINISIDTPGETNPYCVR